MIMISIRYSNQIRSKSNVFLSSLSRVLLTSDKKSRKWPYIAIFTLLFRSFIAHDMQVCTNLKRSCICWRGSRVLQYNITSCCIVVLSCFTLSCCSCMCSSGLFSVWLRTRFRDCSVQSRQLQTNCAPQPSVPSSILASCRTAGTSGPLIAPHASSLITRSGQG